MALSFQYEAVDKAGSKTRGELSAGSKSEAMRLLLGKGLQPVSITSNDSSAIKTKVHSDDELVQLSAKDLIAFTEELSELLEAGLPLEPALASMEQRDENGQLKTVSYKLRQKVTEGMPMYKALPSVSSQFDTLYCNLVRAGEASGSLQTILHQHGRYLKEQMELRAKLTQAFVYPAFLVLACIGVSIVFIFYLLPKITVLLERMSSSEMPIGVTLAVGIGDVLKNHWGKMILATVMILLLFKIWAGSEQNKKKWDHWKMCIPLYGKVVTYGFYVQWLKTLGNLVGNGVNLVKALELTQDTVTNRHAKERLEGMLDRVKDGYKLTKSMRSTNLFTLNMIDLIGVGESTGKLANALNRASDYYDKRLSAMLSKLMGIISPAILLSMALLVAMLSWTMVQAIYQTISNLRG